jgi:hypothetical protein
VPASRSSPGTSYGRDRSHHQRTAGLYCDDDRRQGEPGGDDPAHWLSPARYRSAFSVSTYGIGSSGSMTTATANASTIVAMDSA